jgi:allantoin racemase
MRLLLINPNTTEALTDKVVAAARVAMPTVEIIATTGRFGAHYISSRASYAVASHATLDCYANHKAGCDAVLLACFGDPGFEALREISPIPVIGLVDVACAEAGKNRRRFSIVTGGERWGPMLTEMIQIRGMQPQLASIRTVAPTGGDIAANPAAAYALLTETCRRCMEDDGAEAVILGGAGLLDIAHVIQPELSIPVICSVVAGFNAAKNALTGAQKNQHEMGVLKVETVGLSPELSRLFSSGK